ncbi:hypothetical protein ACYZTX_00200 [Pseudomonas sp. MDT1-17]
MYSKNEQLSSGTTNRRPKAKQNTARGPAKQRLLHFPLDISYFKRLQCKLTSDGRTSVRKISKNAGDPIFLALQLRLKRGLKVLSSVKNTHHREGNHGTFAIVGNPQTGANVVSLIASMRERPQFFATGDDRGGV